MFNSYPVSFSRDFPIDDKSISQKNLKLVFSPTILTRFIFPRFCMKIEHKIHSTKKKIPIFFSLQFWPTSFSRDFSIDAKIWIFQKITCDSRRDMRQEIPYRTSRRSWVCGSNRHDPVRIANFWVFCCKFHKTFLLEMHYLWRSCASSRCVPATGSP